MKLGATLGRWLDMPIGSTRWTWRKFWADSALAYLFLLPSLLVIGTFSLYPVIKAFLLSLTDYHALRRAGDFIGMQNYSDILKDPLFWKSIKNTVIYVVGTVPPTILLALGVAILLNQGIKGRALYRLAFFVPYVATSVAVSMVWAWIFHDQWGLLNYILGWFHIPAQKWLMDPKWTMFTIIVLSIWKTLGYTVVIFLAGLQNLDRELANAARIDGASERQVFRHVTWPLLSPTTFFISITSIIASFKVFTELFVMYGGQPGPLREGITIVFYIYEKAWDDKLMGYASAAAYILFFMVLTVTVFQFWYAKRHVHYD